MTEAEWINCADPHLMLLHLRNNTRERKRTLFACACCRRIWRLLNDTRSRRAVEVAELFADGLASEEQRQEAFSAAWAVNAHPRDFARQPSSLYFAAIAAWLAVGKCTGATSRAAGVAAAHHAGDENAERREQAHLLRDLFGNPFRPLGISPSCRTASVVAQARSIYDERTFDRLPILADALEEAGCTNPDVLEHCRALGPHVRGCWVVDLILGKGWSL